MTMSFKDYARPLGYFYPHRPGPGARRDAYDAVLDGLLEFRASIRMPRDVGMADLVGVLDMVKMDHPALFYVGSAEISCAGPRERPLSLTLRPRYRLSERDALAVAEAMVGETNEIVQEVCSRRIVIAPGEPVYEDYFKDLVMLHDWLVRRFSYADGERAHAHEAAGPLVYGTGVCDGVSRAMKFLCDCCGITCCVVSGRARGSVGPAAAPGPHSWNLVRTRSGGGDVWSNVDVTFDAGVSHGIVRHDYFLRSDAELAGSHWRDEPSPLPQGAASRTYFDYHGLTASSAQDLGGIVDYWWPIRGGVEFAISGCWGSRDELDAAIERGLARSATLGGSAPRAYALYPNYDLMVFGLEGVS